MENKADLSLYSSVFVKPDYAEEYVLSYFSKGLNALTTQSEFKKDRKIKATTFAILYLLCDLSYDDIGKRYFTSPQYVSNIITEFRKHDLGRDDFNKIVKSLSGILPNDQVDELTRKTP
jgi:hypothetical protein